MKQKFTILLLLISILSLPAQAQWYRRAAKTAKQINQAGKTVAKTDTQTGLNQAVQRAVNQAVLQARTAKSTQLPLTHPLSNAVFTVQNNARLPQLLAPKPVIAFAFEITHNGKQQLWGITAAQHGIKRPLITLPNGQTATTEIKVQGSAAMSDLVLFPIPQQLAHHITPLTLAAQDAQAGEEVSSVAFFENGLHLSANNPVEKVSSQRGTIPMPLEKGTDPSGIAGGPVLNAQGEVVGLQVTGSMEEQTSAFVPVSHIYQALASYYHDWKHLSRRDIIFNGTPLGHLRVNEHIYKIELWNGKKRVETVDTTTRSQDVDYQHLEQLVNIGRGDTAVIYVKRVPLSAKDPNQHTQTFRIVLRLLSQNVSVHHNHFYTPFIRY